MLDQGVLGFGQNIHQRILVQFIEGGDDRQPADEFGDQTEFQKVLGLYVAQDLAGLAFVRGAHVGAKTDGRALAAGRDDLVQTGESAAADEQDVGRVHLQELLLGMFAPPLRRHAGHRALHDLEQGLLHALARDVPGDGGVVGFARDLVHLVDVDDAPLGAFNIIIGRLKQF